MRPRGRRILAGATLLLALSARPGTGQTWVADHAGEAIVGIEPLADGGLLVSACGASRISAVDALLAQFERDGDVAWQRSAGGAAELPLGGWIVVTARGACGDGGAGRDSFLRQRQDRPGWSPCP